MQTNQMMWRVADNFGVGQLVLHLRERETDPWQIYSSSPHAVPDHQIANGSKGWATFQFLLKQGWTIVPTPPRH